MAESILPGLPFVLIAVGEGRKSPMGRNSFNLAMHAALGRAVKTGTAMGVGALVVLLDGGFLSLPASFLTRLGMDRVSVLTKSVSHMDKRIKVLHSLRSGPLLPARDSV